MKSLLLAASLLLTLGVVAPRPAGARMVVSFPGPVFYGGGYPVYSYPAYPYGGYPYYPYPLPPAPSLGFGRGGIYGHVFVGRDETIRSYTFPGADSYYGYPAP